MNLVNCVFNYLTLQYKNIIQKKSLFSKQFNKLIIKND